MLITDEIAKEVYALYMSGTIIKFPNRMLRESLGKNDMEIMKIVEMGKKLTSHYKKSISLNTLKKKLLEHPRIKNSGLADIYLFPPVYDSSKKEHMNPNQKIGTVVQDYRFDVVSRFGAVLGSFVITNGEIKDVTIKKSSGGIVE